MTQKEDGLSPDEEISEVHPRVAFFLDELYAVMAEAMGHEVSLEEARRLTSDVLSESIQEMTGSSLPAPLVPQPHDRFPAAGSGGLLYLVEQARSWLGTAADLAQLGALGLSIADRLRDRLGRESRVALFSREIAEGICVEALHERFGLDLAGVSSCSHAFSRWSGGTISGQAPTGEEIYLVWVGTDKDAHLFLIDSRGEIWSEHHFPRWSYGSKPVTR